MVENEVFVDSGNNNPCIFISFVILTFISVLLITRYAKIETDFVVRYSINYYNKNWFVKIFEIFYSIIYIHI